MTVSTDIRYYMEIENMTRAEAVAKVRAELEQGNKAKSRSSEKRGYVFEGRRGR